MTMAKRRQGDAPPYGWFLAGLVLSSFGLAMSLGWLAFLHVLCFVTSVSGIVYFLATRGDRGA